MMRRSLMFVALSVLLPLFVVMPETGLAFDQFEGKVASDEYRGKAFSDVACLVMSMEGGASLTRGRTRIRSSIKKGDVVFKGDSANLSYGAKVTLSYDPRGFDVIHFEGPCTINFITETQIELSHGKAIASLNDRRGSRLFKIKTPGAIASAKTARFLVEVKHQGAEIKSFKSEVAVYGVNTVGDEQTPGLVLHAGQKTSVTKLGKMPKTPAQNMTDEEMKEAGTIRRIRNKALGWMRQQSGDWLKERFETKAAPDDDTPVPGLRAEYGGKDGLRHKRDKKVHDNLEGSDFLF